MGFPLLNTEQVTLTAVATIDDPSGGTNPDGTPLQVPDPSQPVITWTGAAGVFDAIDQGAGVALIRPGDGSTGSGTGQCTATDPNGHSITVGFDVDVSAPAVPTGATAIGFTFGTPEPKV